MGIAWKKNNKIFFDSIELNNEDLNIETRNLRRIGFTVFDYIIKNIINESINDHHLIGIEKQWMGINPEMTMVLVELRGIIEGMFYNYSNIEIVGINPRKWQTEILNVGKKKSKEIKEMSKIYGAKLTGKNPTEDESDSLCMLQWLINNYGSNIQNSK